MKKKNKQTNKTKQNKKTFLKSYGKKLQSLTSYQLIKISYKMSWIILGIVFTFVMIHLNSQKLNTLS